MIGLLLGVAIAFASGGVAGWCLRQSGEAARRRATEVYYEERLKVCERARNRARVEADDLEHRVHAVGNGNAPQLANGTSDLEAGARERAGQRAELTSEIERMQARLRERDATCARLRSELDARNADRAQHTNGRGELARLRTELARARDELQDREALLACVRAELESTTSHTAGNGASHVTGNGKSNGTSNGSTAESSPGETASLAPTVPEVHGETRRPRRQNGQPKTRGPRAATRGNGHHHGPSWLLTAAEGDRDDLQALRGLGPVLERGLNELGVFHYRQLARMTAEDAAWLAVRLRVFPGRLMRDDWAAQAREMHFRKYHQRV